MVISPETATTPAMGAKPKVKPKIRCAIDEKRLKSVYAPSIAKIGKESLNAKGLIKYATAIKTDALTTMKICIVRLLTRPSTEGLSLVLGFKTSISLSR